ncbi:hypothetical protein Enr13x_00080 [Stieleria neptunia]|uniref:Uncharacterized protein n=1 Tax=Stieleria neptunia TaxID=2527979 RepID=A0A518HH92_9BACT|nr:hypothetical protein Enr13x_00080 [Stieleria neptunia]
MNRLIRFTLAVLVVAACVLLLDYLNVSRKERQLSHAVNTIGGRYGSLPCWPLGTEYRITLTSVPDPGQLRGLTVANSMRGWVGIAFEDCELSHADIDRILTELPQCHLFVVHDGHHKKLSQSRDKADEP